MAALVLAVALLAGCKSKQDEAIEQAKKQAAATGQPQQVVSIDKNGNTTTTTVQPPAPGQTTQTVTTTVTPATGCCACGYACRRRVVLACSTGCRAAGGACAGRRSDNSARGREYSGGNELAIRINQHISVKTSRAGDRFDGEVVEPWSAITIAVILPKGTPVTGVVDESHRRGHFKGARFWSCG